MLEIFNSIIKSIWPLISKFIQPNLKKQNYWNKRSAEKNAKEVKVKDIRRELDKAFYWPVNSPVITSRFGWRVLRGKRRWHNGLDLIGSNYVILSPEEITITKVLEPDKEYPVRFEKRRGVWVKLDVPKGRAWTPYIIGTCHYQGKEIIYKFYHADSSVSPGDVIPAGEAIGKYGQLGYSLGAHLHFEAWIDGKVVDPEKYLKERSKK